MGFDTGCRLNGIGRLEIVFGPNSRGAAKDVEAERDELPGRLSKEGGVGVEQGEVPVLQGTDSALELG